MEPSNPSPSKSLRWFRTLPLPLLRNVLILMGVGLLFVHSATFRTGDDFVSRQIAWILAGAACFFLALHLGYRFFLGVSYFLYVICIGLLMLVLVMGSVHLGARRWLEIGPFFFQPSEFTKLATALALAHFIGSRNAWEGEGKTILGGLFLAGLPFLLIAKQPDLGSAILFLPLVGTVLFFWGIRYRYLIVTALAGFIASPFIWGFLKDYQKKRILVFLNSSLDPLGAGYTAVQSRIAVGSGGLFGKGWMHGTQSQLDFIPEHHTDFIFSVIGEELGFVGSLLLLVLYGTLFYQVFQIIERTTDVKARLLASGILALLFCQVLVNIGMTFGLLPITGITLPFISYGGSSLAVSCLAMGLLVSIHRERSIF